MNLDDLKEQLLARFHSVSERVQDTSSFQQLKERFDSLSANGQKMVIALGGFLIVALIISVPLGWSSESDEFVQNFDERRRLIRELLKVSREASDVPNIPVPPNPASLKLNLEAQLKDSGLLSEQIKAIEPESSNSRLIPNERSDGGLRVQLAKLTLRQITSIGQRLVQISPSLKMTSLQIQATKEDPHYFDVVMKLTALKVPDLSAPPPPPPEEARPGRAGGNR